MNLFSRSNSATLRRTHTNSLSTINDLPNVTQNHPNESTPLSTINDLYNDDMDDDSSLEFESDSEPQLSYQSSGGNNTNLITNNNNNLNQHQPLTVNVTMTNSNSQSSLLLSSNNNNISSTTNNTNSNLAKSKVNPFMPSTIKPRMSFERRRWAHIFPLRSDGTPLFPHWTPKLNENGDGDDIENNINLVSPTSALANAIKLSPSSGNYYFSSKKFARQNSGGQNSNKKIAIINKESYGAASNENVIGISNGSGGNEVAAALMMTSMNGGVMSSSASMKTGVAWKSLTMPACLPLTTDYCPTKQQWNKNFSLLSTYLLILGIF